MKPDVLRNLILSLEPNEKKLFKSKRGTGREKYHLLFEMLAKEPMELEEISRRIGVGIESVRKLIAYLFEAIMRFLDSQVEADTETYRRWARILKARGLESMALVMSSKARQGAISQFEHGTALDVLEWEFAQEMNPARRDELKNLVDEMQEKIALSSRLRGLLDKLSNAANAINNGNETLVRSIGADDLLQSEQELWPKARTLWLRCWRAIHILLGDEINALKVSLEFIEELESGNGSEIERSEAIITYSRLLFRAGKSKEGHEWLVRLGRMEFSSQELKTKIFLSVSATLIASALDSLEIQQGMVLVAEAENKWKQLRNHPETSKLELLAFNAIRLLLVAGAYSECLSWVRKYNEVYTPKRRGPNLRTWVRIHEALSLMSLDDQTWIWGCGKGIRQQAKADGLESEIPRISARIATFYETKGKPSKGQIRVWLDEIEKIGTPKSEERILRLYVPLDFWLHGQLDGTSIGSIAAKARKAGMENSDDMLLSGLG